MASRAARSTSEEKKTRKTTGNKEERISICLTGSWRG